MANVTIGFGAALILLGVAGYVASGAASWTALIPALFGVLLAALGAAARRERARMHAMHAAAVLGVLGLLGSARGLLKLPVLLSGGALERPAAVAAQSAMAVLCLAFVALCVKSFLDARRSRVV
jgi:lysylphosphatidylglycerol synthetase-like protein (DUF2156 family)